jgi:hypothetical protein
METESRLLQVSLRTNNVVIQLFIALQAMTFFGILKMAFVAPKAMEAVAREQSQTLMDKVKEDEPGLHTCHLDESS